MARTPSGEYQQALRLEPANLDALTGAGLSAFDLGKLQPGLGGTWAGVPAGSAAVARTRTVADLVLSADPLAVRLGPIERGRRMAADSPARA